MNSNLSNRTSNVNPLLMNFTHKGKIEEAEDVKYSYNDFTQTTMYDMRTIGTRCLRSESTAKKRGGQIVAWQAGDKKNAIDDSKSVK